MKKLIYILILIPVLALAQSQDQNYVKSTTYKQATTTAIANPSIEQANVQISYFDGLGRPIQQIAHKQAANGKDIVTHIEYDALGRQTKDYLPFTKQASLNYLDASSALGEINSFYTNYNGGTTNPFSEKLLESSPLNRVLKQAAPGDAWAMNSGHEIKFDYQTNEENEVKLFGINTNYNASFKIYNPTIVANGHYPINQLYKTITKDENWTSGKDNTTEEFKNKEGQVVLKRTYESGEKHDTYYVYDSYGNLTYVIPPLAEGNTSADNLEKLCYQYKYDNRNRLVEKKLPGKQWEFIVYDKLDRPVATGPANNPFGGTDKGWMITKYDAFGRVAYTGWFNGTTATAANRNSFQNQMNGLTVLNESRVSSTTIDNVTVGYSNTVYPTNIKLLTINYYDNYTYPNPPSIPSQVLGANTTIQVKGLPTGSWVRVLEDSQTVKAEISHTVYDEKYRPIRSYTKNHLGGYTQVDSDLDNFNGKVLQTVTKHKRTNSDTEVEVIETFEYTPQDRLLRHKHQITGNPEVTLAENSYDELGQLILKTTGNGLQDVDYKYNIRGWLTAINDEELAASQDGFVNPGEGDLFAFKISYDDVLNSLGSSIALYNGNIAETFWKTSTDNVERQYAYEYDKLNRLTKANFIKDPFHGGDEAEGYDEIIKYDKNGNITFLDRMGKIQSDSQPIDQLTYHYDGNQLLEVYDASTSPQGFNDGNTSGDDYDYDQNGNMLFDKNKGIESIIYNHLNLPTQIQFANGNNIKYLYNAVGQKVNKLVQTGEEYANTDYLSGFQYRSSYTNTQGNQSEATLQYFPHAEGYVQHLEGRFFYVYNYTDHLGNIRLGYTYDENTGLIKIMEENHYYPFGLKHESYNTQRLGYTEFINEEEVREFILGEQPKFVGDGSFAYRYNSKEYQDELGLNMYDYGARNYDPAIGRWMNIDPLAEKYTNLSPYSYVANNVVNAIDPDGRLIIFVGGLRGIFNSNDQQFWRRTGFYKTQDALYGSNHPYWNTGQDKLNSFGQQADLIQTFTSFHNDTNHLFTSGSAGIMSSANGRMRQGVRNAKQFYRKYKKGKVELADGEAIRIVSHSQGGAHAAGFADQLRTYKDADGNSLFNIEVIFYITPHQGGNITTPVGIQSFQFSHPSDAVSGEGFGLINLFNGGKHYGKIKNVSFFSSVDIMGGEGQPEAEGPTGNRGGHNATDNNQHIIDVLNDFCKNNPGKCKEITLDPSKANN